MTGIFWLCAAALAGFLAYLIWANRAIAVTEYSFSHEKADDALDGLRIVQVSDLQSACFGRGQRILAEKARAARPDLIVITGDLPDRNHTDYEICFSAVEELVKLAPVYYVNGNHELALPQDEIERMYGKMEAAGVTLLFDRGVRAEGCGDGGLPIFLAGLSEETLYKAKTGASPDRQASCEGRNLGRGRISDTDIDASVIKTAMAQALAAETRTMAAEKVGCGSGSGGLLRILLVHEPQFLETYAEGQFDLIFAGHAHGGQIRLPFTQGLFAPGQGLFPKLTSGIHEKGSAAMVISRGLGNSTFPLRVFNRPEIVIVELRTKLREGV